MKLELKFNKKSIKQLEVKLMDLEIGVHETVAGQQLLRTAEEIMEISGRWVPEDTGALKSARFISEVDFDQNSSMSEITMGYGGVADTMNPKSGELVSSYALKVHEDLITPRAPGKRAKFLELPVLLLRRKFLVRLTKGTQEFFGSVGGSR